MNSGDRPLTQTDARGEADLDFWRIAISDDSLRSIRMALYHSSGDGYYLFRNFLPADFVRHLRQFWPSLPASQRFQPYPGARSIRLGCPNYWRDGGLGNETFFNFFWNPPVDEAAHAVAFAAQLLRNRVEGRSLHREIYPLEGIGAMYRVDVVRSADTAVEMHQDWVGSQFDPRRTQVTIFLSEHDVDYSGRAFTFTTNGGQEVSLGQDLDVGPGDLALWRYNNRHGVLDVRSSPNQIGFLRLLMPPEFIAGGRSFWSPKTLRDLRAAVRRYPRLRRLLLPLRGRARRGR